MLPIQVVQFLLNSYDFGTNFLSGKLIQISFQSFSFPGEHSDRFLENSSIFGNWPGCVFQKLVWVTTRKNESFEKYSDEFSRTCQKGLKNLRISDFWSGHARIGSNNLKSRPRFREFRSFSRYESDNPEEISEILIFWNLWNKVYIQPRFKTYLHLHGH